MTSTRSRASLVVDSRVETEPSLHRPQPSFQPTQPEVGEESQKSGRDRSGKNQLIVNHSQAPENQFAKATCSDGRSNGRESHRDDDCDAKSRKDHTRRQRQLNLPQKLAFG